MTVAAPETPREGLTQSEARARLHRYGPNTLREAKRTSLLVRLLANFTHLMALLLWAGGLVGFLARMPQLGVAIWMVNLINGVFSFWQEYRAEKATEALRRLLPMHARVVRDGRETQIEACELVPGDLMLLAEGEHISADGVLVEAAELRVDESTLTGESRPVPKRTDDRQAPRSKLHAPRSEHLEHGAWSVEPERSDLSHLVFAGTSVASGDGKAIVTATGMETAFGKIARLTQSLGEEPSPLQREMVRVTRAVSLLATSIGALFFALAILVAGVDPTTGFLFAMGMIVAFVPEGMLPTVTLSLAMGVQRMARRNALVKRLSAVETLGCASVICTDKTGTLTQNEMTVRRIRLAGKQLEVSGSGYSPEGAIHSDASDAPDPSDLRRLLVAVALCRNGRVTPPDGVTGRWTAVGDPTDAALAALAMKGGLDLDAELARLPRVREVPFNSHRKRMTTVHLGAEDRCPCAYVKGAPQEVVPLCTRVLWEGREIAMDQGRRAQILSANDEAAEGGLRVLAVAERQLPEGAAGADPEKIERELTFLGLVAMLDPPREGVAEAVARCHRAGIRIVMITGDYGLTAASIARQVGMAPKRVISGAELDAMEDAALTEALQDEVIFARVAPEDKLRVVRALQAMGHVVAVTGDGVNDAPALKQADIGVAMGISGTDVAREAADMVLADDHFASIVNAVEEGRAVYANIRKFAVYVFNSNVAEAVPFVAMLFSRGRIPLPLTVMQILAIDLGTDMVPAIGLGAEAPEAGVMSRPPRSQSERLLTPRLLARAFLWYGLIESVAAMSAYFTLNFRHGWPTVPLAAEGTQVYRMATTMTLAGVVATQVGAVLGCRTNRESLFRVGFLSNRLVLIGIAVELLLLALLVYVPVLQKVFHTAPLGLADWLYVFAWTPVIFLADEARKAFLRRRAPVAAA
jgi:magnesium-transporting ATPase (P-type)